MHDKVGGVYDWMSVLTFDQHKHACRYPRMELCAHLDLVRVLKRRPNILKETSASPAGCRDLTLDNLNLDDLNLETRSGTICYLEGLGLGLGLGQGQGVGVGLEQGRGLGLTLELGQGLALGLEQGLGLILGVGLGLEQGLGLEL